MKSLGLAAVLFFGVVHTALAGMQWQGTGPGGGGAFASVAISVEGTVFVGSDLSGAYRSVDGGVSWQNLGYRNGLQATHVDGVAVDPQQPGTVLLGTDSGLYLSKNCGSAVEAACGFTHKFEAQVSVVRFTGDGVAYAAGIAGYCQEGALFWRSTDHGKSWDKQQAEGLPRGVNVMALRVQPGTPAHVIAISSPERFSGPQTCGPVRWPDTVDASAFESVDGGAHFAALRVPSDMPIEDVKFDVGDANTLWATVHPPTDDVSVNGAVFRRQTSDFKLMSREQTGQIWPLRGGGIRVLDMRRQRLWHNTPYNTADQTGFWQWDEVASKFVHVTSAADYQKWDMGWSGVLHAPQASLNGHVQSFAAVNDDEAWWVDDQFIHKVSQGGRVVVNATVQKLDDGSFTSRHADNAVGAVLAPSPVDPEILYAGYFDMGCFRSDTAQSAVVGWRACNGLPEKLQADGTFANSELNGDWHGFGGNVVAIAPDPVDAKVVWAVHAPHNGEQGNASMGFYKVVRSSDGFATYNDLTYNLTELTQASAIVALSVERKGVGRTLWAIARSRLYTLEIGAKVWTQVVIKPCEGGLLVLALHSQNFVVAGTSGICVSHDRGATWSASKNSQRTGDAQRVWWGPFDATPSGVSDLAFDPANPQRIWMTQMLPDTQNDQPRAGLYISSDAGETWAQVQGFGAVGTKQRNFSRSVAVNPNDPKMIVVGTSVASLAGGYLSSVPMGAFISRDGGKTFAQENAGLSWPLITKLRFAGNRLYALSPGQGVVFSNISP